MNAQLKTVLLTVLTLSLFVIALVELSGVSSTALFNKYHIGAGNGNAVPQDEAMKREQKMRELPKTTIAFDSLKLNFGTITEGDVVKHSFHFKNTGTSPLIISNAVASCGCTIPSFPKEPVQPGGEGDIVVQFNSANKKGHQEKNVMIYSNAQEEAMSVGFTVDVKEK